MTALCWTGHVVIGGHELFAPNFWGDYNEVRSGLSIKTGEGNDTVTISGDVSVDSGGEFTVQAAVGDNVITIDGNLNINNTLDLSIPFTPQYNGAMTGAQGSIITGEGNDIVTITGALSVGNSGDLQGAYHTNNYGTYQITAQGASAEIMTGDGNDVISLGGINLTETGFAGELGIPSTITIDAGDGNDVIAINGQVSAPSYDNLAVSGGAGYDILVLSAPDAATFKQWYQDWLESSGFDSLNCEGIIIHGMKEDEAPDWLQSLMDANQSLDFQFYAADVNLNMVADVGTIGSYTFDGTDGANDMLYLRFDADTDNLDGLVSAFENEQIKGLENLLLDMADGEGQNLNVDSLDDLLSTLKGETNILLRMDQDDAANLQERGWSPGETVDFNGVEYIQYTSADDQQQLYVQLVTINS